MISKNKSAKGKKRGFRKKAFKLTNVFFFVLAVAVIFLFRKWLFVNPFKPYQFKDVAYASRNISGEMLISNKSGKELLRVNEAGVLLDKIKNGNSTFDVATYALDGPDKNMYVYEVIYDKGVRIESERILRLNSFGKRQENLNEKKKTIYSMRVSIAGIKGTEDSVYIIKKEHNSLDVYNHNNQLIKSFPFLDTNKWVFGATYVPATEKIYCSTYRGEVFECGEDGGRKLLYNSDESEDSVPVDVCADANNIYVADVGNNDIICIDMNTKEVSRIKYPDDYDDIMVSDVLTCDSGGLCSVSEEGVVIWNDGKGTFFDEVRLSNTIVVKCILLWISLAFVILIIFFQVSVFVIKVIRKRDTTTRIAFSIIVSIVLIGVLFLGTLFPSFREQYLQEIYAREELAAATLAQWIDTNAFMELSKPSDFMGESYREVRSAARDIFLSGRGDDLYCEVYKIRGDKISIVYTLEDIYCGYPSGLTVEEMDAVIEKGHFERLSSNTSQGSYLYVMCPIKDKSGNTIGIIEVGTDMTNINEKNGKLLINLIINVAAVTMIINMLVVELLYYTRGKKKYSDLLRKGGNKGEFPSEIYRFVVFLIYFFTNLTAAILPIYAIKISKNMSAFGLSPEILAAIPISAEVFSGALTGALGGKIVRKLGVRKTVILSSFLFTGSLFLRIIPNIWVLSLSSLLLGMGWGVELFMVEVLTARLPETEKDVGYAHQNAASLSGSNIAIVLGGFWIQWIPYSTLFAITAVLSIVLIFVSYKYLIHLDYKEVKEENKKETKEISLFKFLFSRRVITFFLFLLMPVFICTFFLSYLFPILGENWGLSETYIGYSYILNGICAITIGSKMTRYFSVKKKKVMGLFMSVSLFAVAFLLVSAYMSVLSLIIALVLIGLADSFGTPLLSGYYTDLKEVERFGYDKSIGLYSLIGNGAMSLGSFVFGLILIGGTEKGLIILAISIIIMGVIFVLFSRDKKTDKDVYSSKGNLNEQQA